MTGRILIGMLALIVLLGAAGSQGAESEPVGYFVDRAKEGSELQFCKYCGRSISAGAIHRDAESSLEKLLKEKMQTKGIRYVEGSDAKRVINVFVYRFEQRRGGNFAADRPASVGFHMHLLEGGAVQRLYEYDETQKPLLGNLLDFGKFVERGGRWVTAEALAGEGVEKGLNYMMELLQQ